MSEATSTRSSRRRWQALLQWSAVGVAAAVIVACGGGGDTSLAGGGGVGAGGTGITGMVNGFGSVIVGGVRYDDSSASVTPEDASDDSKLRLGMTVDVSVDDSCAVAATSCVARDFEVHSDLAGEITAATLDGSGNGTITVMGQDIAVTSNTFVHRSSLVAPSLGLGSGQIVKVHGRRAAASAATDWVATYIEIKAASDAGLASLGSGFQFRLAGVLTGSAGNYQIGGEPVSLTGTPPTGFVRARITPAADRPAGGWVVTEIKSKRDRALEQRGRSRVEVQGYVETAAVEANRTVLVINGVDVIVSSAPLAVEFKDGATYADLATETRVVEVKGTINSDGQLVATKLEISDENEREFHVRASEIPDASVNTTAKTFTVSKSKTDDLVVEYGGLTLTGLTEGVFASAFTGSLEIKGTIDRTTGHLVATSIKRD